MSPIPDDHYPRPVLAAAFAMELLGEDPLSDARNGLCLAGPRRTGKSRFLLRDLKPELERRGCLVLYVDLWEDSAHNALMLIRTKVEAALKPFAPPIQKLGSTLGVSKLNVAGAGGIDLAAGSDSAPTLYETLRQLADKSKKTLVLMVDEAQEAMTTDAGQTAMRALKSARDQFQGAGSNLLLVMAGSHRDKLLRLVNTAAAPFFGTSVREMPLLDDGYVKSLRASILERRPEWSGLRLAVLQRCFEHYGCRPQLLLHSINAALVSAGASAQDFEQVLLSDAQAQRARDRDEFLQTYASLEPMQQWVLERMLSKREQFRPYDAAALAWYAEKSGGAKVTVAAVQAALEALRAPNLRLVWKELRGNYEVYDKAMYDWYDELVANRAWS